MPSLVEQLVETVKTDAERGKKQRGKEKGSSGCVVRAGCTFHGSRRDIVPVPILFSLAFYDHALLVDETQIHLLLKASRFASFGSSSKGIYCGWCPIPGIFLRLFPQGGLGVGRLRPSSWGVTNWDRVINHRLAHPVFPIRPIYEGSHCPTHQHFYTATSRSSTHPGVVILPLSGALSSDLDRQTRFLPLVSTCPLPRSTRPAALHSFLLIKQHAKRGNHSLSSSLQSGLRSIESLFRHRISSSCATVLLSNQVPDIGRQDCVICETTQGQRGLPVVGKETPRRHNRAPSSQLWRRFALVYPIGLYRSQIHVKDWSIVARSKLSIPTAESHVFVVIVSKLSTYVCPSVNFVFPSQRSRNP